MSENPKDPFDNDDDEFDPEGFDPEEMFNLDEEELAEAEEEIKKERERTRNMSIVKCAKNIRKLTLALVETFKEEEDKLMMKQLMMENAFMLEPKIAGAEAADLYSIRMENAVIIKIHARELLAQTSLCKAEKLTKPEYLQLLRDEIENFRKLFVEWVRSFDRSNDIKDNWGLFED